MLKKMAVQVTFRSFPKDPQIKNPKLLAKMKEVYNRCEWPDGCSSNGPYDAAHIRSRGAWGHDTDDNISILCRYHHRKFDHQMGQGRKNREWMRTGHRRRTPKEKRQIKRFLDSQSCKIP